MLAAAEPQQGAEQAKVVFSSVRPADYSVPYSVLEKNGVAFSAVDKRSNKLLTVMVGGSSSGSGNSGGSSGSSRGGSVDRRSAAAVTAVSCKGCQAL